MAAGDTAITITGNLVDDPELRYTPTGQAVARFRVASTPRFMDRQTNEWKDGESLFLSCNVWRQAAENVAESLQRGMRVIVQGRLKQRSYETKEGEKRTVYEVEVDEVGPSLRNASAKVTKTQRSGGSGGFGGGGAGGAAGGGNQGGYGGQGGGRQQADDPWATDSRAWRRRVLRRAAVLDTYSRSPHRAHSARGGRPSPLRRGSAKEHHDGQATDSQAQKEGLPVLPGKDRPRGL